MPINTPHPEYEANASKWQECRDCIEGEDAIKARGETYLPKLEKQGNREYLAYKKRASFFGATRRTLEGISGAILRREPRIVLPSRVEELAKQIGRRGSALREVIRFAIEEAVAVGRLGILADAPDGGQRPFLSTYRAESIVSWEEQEIDGRQEASRIVLRERYLRRDSEDPYKFKESERYRELFLDGVGGEPVYRVRTHVPKDEDSKSVDREFEPDEEKTPTAAGGKTFNRIPFEVIGAKGTDLAVAAPPLLEVVKVNLAHYRGSADLEHGRHWTAIPTPYVANGDPKTDQMEIGPSGVWVIPGENVTVGMLEFEGAGLGHLAEGQRDKERQMAILGARLLEGERAGVEAAETVRLRQSGEQSVLSKLAQSTSDGLTKAMQWIAYFVNPAAKDVVEIEVSNDFDPSGISSEMLIALTSAAQAGLISWQTFFEACRRGELYPDGVDAETEAAQIAAGLPGGGSGLPSVARQD